VTGADPLTRAAELLAAARRPLVATGAGMSRESGIPTFRDAQEGLWARFDPQELATPEGFRRAPARVWGWYQHRRRRIAACEPHAGHLALAELEGVLPSLPIVTQNIDGLHQRAGSGDVIELHGNIHVSRCLDADHPAVTDPRVGGAEDAECEPPRCQRCGSPLRPGVVWFGEILPQDAVSRAWALAERCDLLLVVGTSGVVWPAAEIPHIAARRGVPVVEVNPAPSELSSLASIFIQAPAGEALPSLVREVRSRLGGGEG
jgi:NAD-dependent deacetylase